ncbi:MAG: exodeoxyribonuclease VII large subunit [Clostridioides sp.]|nr:exodeoxyribonuclease VII large subunit [Clostridioides sp.]
MEIRALDISELNSYIKRILINDPILDNIKVKGEISNFKIHSSGNVYLSLKDEKSKLNCVIFKNNFDRSLNLENGTKVIARGYISVYERDGSYQMYINEMEIEGVGNLFIEFNKLKERLGKEGLFKSIHKKTIPNMPENIGVVTSPTGAVIRDIINVIKRRYPKVGIKLYPVNVQGSSSAEEICEGIRFFNESKCVDTIIVGRGGGSIEELWSFNEEIVAREVFLSEIPIISAVGHETDFTICDFVADLRAPTPSAAAEIATPSLEDLNYKMNNIKGRLLKSLINQVNMNEYMLKTTFDRINSNLETYVVKDKIIQLDMIYDKITYGIENNLNREKDKLLNTGAILHNLSPLATLKRGYSITQKDEKVITSVESVEVGEKIDLILRDGKLDCVVEGKIDRRE